MIYIQITQYTVVIDEPWSNVSRDVPHFFGDIEPENVAFFVTVPKA